MAIGMFIHRLAPPRPPPPSFSKYIPTVISPRKGWVRIQFYVPRDYNLQKDLRKKKFPVVINFHGGGFTLGTATDDARWAQAVVEECGAVVASVDYRLAPENPFPTAVEDGVDALIYIAQHSEELLIDTDNIALSGFSSGGNMAFTVPLRLQAELTPDTDGDSATELQPVKSMSSGKTLTRIMKEVKITAIVAWYPSTDYTNTREQRRETCTRKDQQLSAVFTELFDESYLQPPTMDMGSPYLSPGVAPEHMLSGLPDNIILYTYEWDMLLAEGERMKARLEDIGKHVNYRMVPKVPHGWDKAPNPFALTPGVQGLYVEACRELSRIFDHAEG